MASRPLPLWRRLDGGHLPEGRALRGHRADLPPPGGSTSWTAPASSSGSRPSRPAPSSRACARCPPCGRRTVPWCAVIVRNSFGVAGAAHQNGGRYCTRYAWPSGRWGSLPLEGGIEAAYRADLDAAADPPGARWRRSRTASTSSARPSAPRRPSGSRRSSTRARRARCSASWPTSPRRSTPGPSAHGMRP